MILRRAGRRGVTWGFEFEWGGRRYRRRGYATKGIAEDAEADQRQALRDGQVPSRGRVEPLTWTEAVQRYEAAKAGKADLVAHDRPRLAWWGTFFGAHDVTTLQGITPELIDQGKAALAAAGRSAATQQRYLAVLKHLCQLACRRWLVGVPPRPILGFNPVLAVDWPTAEPMSPRVPTLAHVQRLLRIAPAWLRPLILVAVSTGLRRGSCLRLDVADLCARPGALRAVQKGRRVVFLPITPIPQLARVLRQLELAAGEGPLFRWPDGRVMTRFPRKAWARACAAAGLPWLRFHALRHLTGTVLAEAGVPLRVVQEWLGHATARMTEHYTRTVRLQAAARVLGRRRW